MRRAGVSLFLGGYDREQIICTAGTCARARSKELAEELLLRGGEWRAEGERARLRAWSERCAGYTVFEC